MHGNALMIVVVSVAGGLVFAGALTFFILGVIKKTIARQRAALEHEGIVLDSGSVWMTERFSNFRAPGIARGVGIEKKKAALVLSRARLVIVPSRWQFESIPLSEMHRFQVGLDEEGRLRLHTENPPNASGSFDVRVPVDDKEGWVRALSNAGARNLQG